MKNNILPISINVSAFILLFIVFSCSSDKNDYVAIEVSPVVVNLAQVPYPNLSDYKFFAGEMKDQQPSYGVIPYRPASELFSDYALKKRFIWLPNGTKATYVSDGEILNLPLGSAIVKTFYYNHVQPSNTAKILETRVMIRKANSWIFADYVWNDDQTEATLQTQGSTVVISWIDETATTHTIDYKIPSENDCKMCHDISSVSMPIGIKPQNLNNPYNYGNATKNQLSKWIEFGYLEDNLPASIVSTVDYNDTTQSLDLRVRSYFDINCAFCHQSGGNVEFVNIRMAFNQTTNPLNMGVCAPAILSVPGIPRGQIVSPQNSTESTLLYTLSTNATQYRMPRLGRTVVHEEGIQLVKAWINSLPACN